MRAEHVKIRHHRIAWAGVLVMVYCASVQARALDGGAEGWSVSLSSDRHIDALGLRWVGSDDAWSHLTPRSGRNVGYLFDEARVSTHRGDWQWSLLARQYALATASEGALDLVRTVQTGSAPRDSRAWQTQLDFTGFAGWGLELGHEWRVMPGVRVQAAAQGLSLRRLSVRSVSGSASYDALSGAYSASLDSREANDRRTFPYQSDQAHTGTALLFSGALSWTGDRFGAAVRWRDAGVLNWRGLPQQDLALSSDIAGTDADGFVTYRPLVQGQNSQAHYRQWLRARTTWEVSMRTASFGHWIAAVDWIPGWGGLPAMRWTQAQAGWMFGLGYRFHEQRAELSLAQGDWSIVVGRDLRSDARSTLLGLRWGR